MKLLFILLFILVYLIFGLEIGYTTTSPWYTHITYMFQHGSWWHLVLNSIAFYSLYLALERIYRPSVIALFAVTSAFVCSWLCMRYTQPVVGASGMIYAMIGMYLYLVSIGIYKYKNRRTLIFSLLVIVASLISSFFHRNSAGLLHLLCLCSGFAFASSTGKLCRIPKRNKNKSQLSS